MPHVVEVAKHDTDVGPAMRDDSEYESLVASGLPKRSDVVNLHSKAEARLKSIIWWIKILLSCINVVAVARAFVKWGVPFLFEKVSIPMMQWEATAFGRPVLAVVLIASLAIFHVLLIPSGPSMWLAGMIFRYRLGFVIIMVGTTVGMVLPYLLGLQFCDKIHKGCKDGQTRLLCLGWPQKVVGFISSTWPPFLECHLSHIRSSTMQ